MAIDTRHRDTSGEISRKHGNTLIHTLRIAEQEERLARDAGELEINDQQN